MVQLRPAQTSRFRRDAWLEINLENLEFNLKQIYSWFNKPLIPVLKADAYGHGAAILARILDSYDFVIAYAVASVDEALALRESTKKRIIVLGICPEWAIEQAIENDIELTIVDENSAKKINQVAVDLNKQASIHIKFDTGMNRIGFKEQAQVEGLSNTKIETLYTHFADPSSLDLVKEQNRKFKELSQGLNLPRHPASTQAAKALGEELEADYIRCGIELYGLENPDLKPLMSLYSRISFVKDIKAGESVSYKQTWTAEKDTRIATLPLGYADGVPRLLSNKIKAYAKGQYINQIGLITMDQMMFELGVDSDIKAGDSIELIGPHLSISEWAEIMKTISYELVSSLNLRLPKTYT